MAKLKRDRLVVTTGVFDPLVVEELKYLIRCKTKGDWLIVGLHSDFWAVANRGGFMLSYDERRQILEELICVDEVFRFDDSDGTACQLLKVVKSCYPNAEIIFVSEEDMHNMPETKIHGITFETMKQE